jgi:glycosyltransferase involved in cell wall biosynthesis
VRIAVWHNLPSGGGKRALYDHVRGLVERGHHVEAWAPPTIDRSYLPLDQIIAEHIVPLDEPKPRSIGNLLQLTLHTNQQLAAMEAHSRICAEQIAAGGFDILFANSCIHFRTAMIGRFVDMPSVHYLQEPYRWLYEAMPNPFWAAPEKRSLTVEGLKDIYRDIRKVRSGRIQVREEVRNARAFGRILCNSYFSRESILRAYGLDAQVCYLGVDTERFSLGPDERQDFVVGLGSFTREKNPRLCIEAIGRMKGSRPALVWVGNFAHADYLAEMMALAEARGVDLQPRINIPDAELLGYVQAARAMIYAPRLEPFGLAPIEAGACGTAVVAVAEGGVRETVVDGVNGLLADGEPDALAAALERVCGDPELARNLGREGRRLAETKWSHAASTDRLVAKLEAEIASRKSPA